MLYSYKGYFIQVEYTEDGPVAEIRGELYPISLDDEKGELMRLVEDLIQDEEDNKCE